jgi:hypothetical protein
VSSCTIRAGLNALPYDFSSYFPKGREFIPPLLSLPKKSKNLCWD